MTISKAIIDWLYGFGNIDVDERIDTDALSAASQSLGLYKTPQASVKAYVDGTRDVTAYYNFMAKQGAQTNSERASNQAWMEALEAWVRRKNIARELPTLGEHRDCSAASISSSYFMLDGSDENATYQLTLAINYTERMST